MSNKTKEKPSEELGLKVEVGRRGGEGVVVVVDVNFRFPPCRYQILLASIASA